MKNKNLEINDNWETPEYIYNPLNEKYNFDFDPCPLNSGEIKDENNGLLIEWGKRNFINPPYSRKLKEAFVNKAVEVSNSGALCVVRNAFACKY